MGWRRGGSPFYLQLTLKSEDYKQTLIFTLTITLVIIILIFSINVNNQKLNHFILLFFQAVVGNDFHQRITFLDTTIFN